MVMYAARAMREIGVVSLCTLMIALIYAHVAYTGDVTMAIVRPLYVHGNVLDVSVACTLYAQSIGVCAVT